MRNSTIKLILIVAVLPFIICSCARDSGNNPSASKIVAAVRNAAAFSDPREESLLDRETAERYGISLSSVRDGIVYYDAGPESADKIIIVTASGKDGAEKVERALESEKTRLTDALEDDKEQRGKTDGIVVKTRGFYCILILSQNVREIERIFDGMT